MINSIIVDGVDYKFAVSVKRKSVIVSSDNSGMLLNGTYFNDVIGTYLEYEVSVAIPAGQENAYNTFYEVITSPTAFHDFILPYSNERIIVRGRIDDNAVDVYMQKNALGKVTWREISFTISESISRKMSAGTYTPVTAPDRYLMFERVNDHLIFTVIDWSNIST